MTTGVRWSLESFFPNYGSPEMVVFREKLAGDISSLFEVTSKADLLDISSWETWEGFFLTYEEILSRATHYAAYIHCLSAQDASDERYQRESAMLDELMAGMEKLSVNFRKALKDTDEKTYSSFKSREKIADAGYFIDRLRHEASVMMDSPREILAADLDIDGKSAWSRLYDTISGKMQFSMKYPDGSEKMIPMAQRRSLMEDPDRRVRSAAFHCGNEAWQNVEDVTAAALNHIAGTRLSLDRCRSKRHFLDDALFEARISPKTLDALFEAISRNRDFIQGIAKVKARALGLKKLAWFDLDAPLPVKDSIKMDWNTGVATVEKAFSATVPDLAEFFRGAISKGWVESEPRAGKRPGAFCTSSWYNSESRVFMTYNGTLGNVQTLAHEIGHAYHGRLMKDIRGMCRAYPMTLAETASTFAEALLAEGLLADPAIPDSAKANILNTSISHGIAFLMDIPVRFEFEKSFYEERSGGIVSVSRLKELMVNAQKRILGPILEEGGEDEYFWASKLHFYISSLRFYNFPYTFGFLLSRGLFDMFKSEGCGFLKKYEMLLRLSGSDSAEKVVFKSIGADIEKPEFWSRSIQSMKPDLVKFEKMISKML